MTPSLRDRLLKAIEFNFECMDGAEENARLKPILEALVECADEADNLCWSFPRPDYFPDIKTALAKLEALLPKEKE